MKTHSMITRKDTRQFVPVPVQSAPIPVQSVPGSTLLGTGTGTGSVSMTVSEVEVADTHVTQAMSEIPRTREEIKKLFESLSTKECRVLLSKWLNEVNGEKEKDSEKAVLMVEATHLIAIKEGSLKLRVLVIKKIMQFMNEINQSEKWRNDLQKSAIFNEKLIKIMNYISEDLDKITCVLF
jgi:hypothetical protein